MRTTVVHRRPTARSADISTPCSRPLVMQVRTGPIGSHVPVGAPVRATAPWSTAKLGLVVSAVAAVVALVVDAMTTVPSHAIVVTVMLVAFALSMHATARRPMSPR